VDELVEVVGLLVVELVVEVERVEFVVVEDGGGTPPAVVIPTNVDELVGLLIVEVAEALVVDELAVLPLNVAISPL